MTKVPNFAKKITFFATIRDGSPFGTAFHDIIGEFLSALEPRVGARRLPNHQKKDKLLLKFSQISHSSHVSATFLWRQVLFCDGIINFTIISFHLRQWLQIKHLFYANFSCRKVWLHSLKNDRNAVEILDEKEGNLAVSPNSYASGPSNSVLWTLLGIHLS